MRGRLEREIRLLPQVLSCSVMSDDVVVLVSPSAEAATVEAEVRSLLGQLGSSMDVRVLGGYEPPSVSSFRFPLPSNTAIRGTLVCAGAAGALALVAGLTGVEVPRLPGPRPPAITAVAPPQGSDGFSRLWFGGTGAGLDLGDLFGGSGSTASGSPSSGILPVASTRTGSGGGGSIVTIEPDRPAGSGPVGLTPAPSDPSSDGDEGQGSGDPACRTAPDRGAPRARHDASQGRGHDRGRGRPSRNGPPIWSRSILVPPHDPCAHGRP